MATELEKIISVSGKPGLFKVISAGKAAVVAESLLDGKRQPILSSQRVSTLADISMFTVEEDVALRDVLVAMKKVYEGQPCPTGLSGKDLKKEFKKVLPSFDEERVYESDIKKLYTWYNLLQSTNLLDIESTEEISSENE